jgi:DNA-binding transcriptional ArsR family regulator
MANIMADQSPETKEYIARVFKALGDANRLDIVTAIGKDTRSVTEIVQTTGLSQTLVSFHLRILREAQIVTTKRNGPFILYSLSGPVFRSILLKLSNSMNSKRVMAANTGASSEVKNTLRRRRQ